MFGRLGLPELILILVIALIFFGPGKLPDVGKAIGRAVNEFRNASSNDGDKGSRKTEDGESHSSDAPKKD